MVAALRQLNCQFEAIVTNCQFEAIVTICLLTRAFFLAWPAGNDCNKFYVMILNIACSFYNLLYKTSAVLTTLKGNATNHQIDIILIFWVLAVEHSNFPLSVSLSVWKNQIGSSKFLRYHQHVVILLNLFFHFIK